MNFIKNKKISLAILTLSSIVLLGACGNKNNKKEEVKESSTEQSVSNENNSNSDSQLNLETSESTVQSSNKKDESKKSETTFNQEYNVNGYLDIFENVSGNVSKVIAKRESVAENTYLSIDYNISNDSNFDVKLDLNKVEVKINNDKKYAPLFKDNEDIVTIKTGEKKDGFIFIQASEINTLKDLKTIETTYDFENMSNQDISRIKQEWKIEKEN